MTLKKFLKALTDDGRYYAELVDNLAEIYYLADSKPSVLVEIDNEVYYLNFRSDLMPNIVAQIAHDISRIGVNIAIGPVFAITKDKGITYGNEAMGMHYINIFLALQSSQAKEDNDLKDALFVVKDPLPVCMIKKPNYRKTNKKYKKMWDE